MVKKLYISSFDFWIPATLLLFLETQAHFKMLYLLKQLSFHYGFYDIVLVKNIYLLAGHLLKFKFCCQPCDVIFCQKPLKPKNKKHTSYCMEYKVLPLWKLCTQMDKNCNFYVVPWLQLSDLKVVTGDPVWVKVSLHVNLFPVSWVAWLSLY